VAQGLCNVSCVLPPRCNNFQKLIQSVLHSKHFKKLHNPGKPKWSIVYDLTNRRIHFRTLDNPEIRTVRLNGFDFSCASPVRVFDLDQSGTGDVTPFFLTIGSMNKELIQKSYQGTPFLAGAPEAKLIPPQSIRKPFSAQNNLRQLRRDVRNSYGSICVCCATCCSPWLSLSSCMPTL
jgi:hypothetical protein